MYLCSAVYTWIDGSSCQSDDTETSVYYFQTTYASKSENSSPFIIYYIPPPPCFGLYFVFTPYVMGFGVLAEELAASGAWLCIKIAVMCYTSDCRNYTGHIPFIVWKNDLW